MKIRRPKMAEADPVNEPVDAESVRPQGSEAAAILLMLLGDEDAAAVLSRPEPADVQSLGSAMFGVADVSEEQVENVFAILHYRATARPYIGFASPPRIRAVLDQAQ